MEKYTGLEIAVIGMSGKFPDADNIQQFWENLKHGKDCISDFTEEEVKEEGEQESLIKNASYVKANAYLKNKKYFDSEFFGYTPHEAELMDPQVRLYHECCWEALEDSGCDLQDRTLKIGVFSAGYPNIPWMLYTTQNPPEGGFVDDFTAAHLRDATFLSSRISYKFNLKGPSVFVQTACSSSLVAIHEGCNSLLLGECHVVLAGGVNVKNYSKKGYLYQAGMIHSKDGKCRPFDVQSSGTVGGEGAGVVVLKRLKDAIRDKDNIQAIIKGTAINNDGSSKVGYTAPSVQGQTEVIKRALAMAKVDANSISYIETHGTATALGDPIEVEALNTAFGKNNEKECAIGSVKSNIGHLDSAAGVAGFIKTVLALKNRELPPSLHYTEANSGISFSNGPFYVNNTLKQWGTTSDILRAGVSSFGIGGTNAHLVLQEAPSKAFSEPGRSYQLLTLSGKTITGFQGNVAKLKKFFNENQQVNIADAAYTLQTGRDRFKYRKTIVCTSINNAVEQLDNIALLEPIALNNQEELQHIIFMFPGQGAQYVRMCKELYETEIVFREEIDACLEHAQEYINTDFRSILFTKVDGASNKINDTEHTQPILFFIEYALAKLLLKWGITPDYMIGHSIGEYAAACLGGVFELEDAIRLVIKRGSLMSKVSKGAMLSITVSKDEVDALLESYDTIDLAVVNSEKAVVVSGTIEAIDDFKSVLDNKGISSKKLHTSHAFHSRMMDSVLADFDEELKKVNIKSPKIPFISNLSGKFVTSQEVQAASYWTQHLRSTVNFKQGIDTLLTHGDACFIEVGPGKTLSNYVNENKNKTSNHHTINTVRHVKQDINDQKYLLEKMGQLWERGIAINWKQFYDKEERYKISLPTYAFDKKEYTTNFNLNALLNRQLPPIANNTGANKTEFINIYNWKRSVLPNEALELDNKKSNFLIFRGEEAFSHALSQELVTKQQHIIEIKPGPHFKKVNDGLFEVNISVLDHIEQLWGELEKIKFRADEIIYSLPLSEKYTLLDYNAIEKGLDKNYLGISYIAKTIVNYQNNEEVKITVLCNHLAKVVADDNVDPLKAVVLSPAKIIPSEISSVQCKVIDIPYPFISESEQREYANKVINEMFFETDDAFVAYRYNERWFKDIETFYANEKTVSNVSLIAGGTYLIVGGTGGIGLSIVTQMSSEIQGNFILVHRSDFPEKETWEAWLEVHDDDNEISKKMLQIQEIESLGSVVELHQLDVADESRVKLFSEKLSKDQVHINGLIWAAGEVDYGGIILNRSKEDFIKYSASKIHGIVLFEKYIKFDTLDFLALFSSIGNIIYQVKFGQVAYNAGNEFLESYAKYAKKQWGVHAFTINWCDWYDVGLTVNAIREQDHIEDIIEINSRIDHAISPKKGVELFFRCLKNKQSTFNIFPGQLKETITSKRSKLQEYKNNFIETPEEVNHTIVNEGDNLENILKEIYTTFFGKEIGSTDDFFEVGGDSLKAMSLSARINQRIGANLAINDIYQCPTIKEIVNKLSETGDETQIITIPNTPLKEYYTTSSEQKRMFLLQALDLNSTLYNEIEVLWVIGEINKKKVEEAFKQIIQRHESLRTSFVLIDDALKQEVLEDYDFHLELLEYQEDQLDETVKSFIRPFDLIDKNTPLLRVGLVEKSPTEHLLIMDSHHIVMDGVSRFIIREEFNTLYYEGILSPLKLQYKDYAEWQNSKEQKARINEEKSFWLNEFSGELEPLELPTDFVRPLTRNNEGDFIRFEIGQEETKKLKDIATADGTTVYTVLVAVLNVLLSKLTNQEDVIIATPVAGRQHADLENLIGMFVNTVCLRSYPEGEKSFEEFLSEVKGKTLACFKNQSYPFEALVSELKIARDHSRNPLFDVMFVYQNYEAAKNETEGLIFKPEQFNHTTSRFDMTLLAVDDADQLFLRLIFSTQLFTKETAQRFVSYFKNIVSAIINNHQLLLSDIDIIPQEEKEKVLLGFNNTSVANIEKNVVQLFAEQVKNNPNNIALIHHEQQLTYLELDKKANAIAERIHEKVSGSNHKIGLLFNHSTEMIICLLGVIKSGNAYVPLSAEDPDDRKQFILSNCNASLLLIQEAIYDGLKAESPITDKDKMLVIGDINEVEKAPIDPESIDIDDLLYVIYTSGTTGKPKGVEIRHRSIINYALWGIDYHRLSPQDVTLQLVSYHFDGFGSNFYQALLSGGIMITVPHELKLNTPYLIDIIHTKKVTNFALLPGLYNEILDEIEIQGLPNQIRFVVLAGEKSSINLIQKSKKVLPSISLENQYGPTEATIGCTHNLTLNMDSTSNIGKPIWNTEVYILDNQSNLLPIGVEGEIHIAGQGIAKGYIDNNKLTDEKFVINPFGTYEKMYKTGDIGKWLPDGSIEMTGRKDDQIKIRGFRVEPDEIRNHIIEHQNIKQSEVIIKEKEEQKYLVAYYISDIDLDVIQLRGFLAERIPDYMVPSYFVRMEKFPYSQNGKLDKRLMPEPTENISEYVLPSNPEEKILTEVWSKVLGIENIGITDNFFLVGGDSIKSIQISSRLRSLGYEVLVKDILTSKDIRTLATKLKKTKKQSDQSTVTGEAILSPIQQWFFENNSIERHHFNQSVLLDFHDGITEDIVKSIFEKIQEHHDILRTVYKENTEELTACYLDTHEFPVSLKVFDLKGVKDPSAILLSESVKIQSGININTGPLMQLGLFQMDKGSRLLIVIHHLAVDGVSWRILFEDIETLYQQIKNKETLKLPLKTDSFKIWTDKLIDYANSDTMALATAYWNEELKQPYPVLKRDKPDGENIFKHKAIEQFQLDKEVTAKLLSDVHFPFGTQINDILLTAFLWTYSELFNTNNVFIDLESHGRESLGQHENIGRTVGWFTSFYPVLLQSGKIDENHLNTLIKEVKEKLRRIPNKGIDYLISKYFTENDIDTKSNAQISFNYLGQFDADIANSSFTIGKEAKGDEISLEKQRDYDWDLGGIITEGRLTMSLMYSSKQYNHDTITTVMSSLKNNLEKLITYCSNYDKKESSPSDFIYKDLSFGQLAVLSKVHDIQNIYPLSPMQEGMLFHYLMSPNSESYFGQMTFDIHGELDIEAVEKSMNELIDRHEILRTTFVHEGYERPIQLVLKERKIKVNYRDLLDEIPKGDIEKEVDSYKEKEKHNSFDLSKDQLMRLTILRTAEEKHTFIWSYHHILMDGWCTAIILSEFREIYSKIKKGLKVDLPFVNSYHNHIEWLEDRDKQISITYWKNYLEDYRHPVSMPKINDTSIEGVAFDSSIEYLTIGKGETDLIQGLTVEYGVTINTIIQCAWGMLLAKYNNVDEVVFGVVVSGRPAEIDGIESMIGLFINTIPVRIKYSEGEDLGDILKKMQKKALETEQHQYHPLSEIQSYSTLGRALFDHIVVIENYPVIEDQGMNTDKTNFLVKNVEMYVQSNYDLSLVVALHDDIEIKIEYNANVYDKTTVQSILAHLNHVILQVILPSKVEVV